MLQLGMTEDESFKPLFANMPAGARIDTVTLEQALQAFMLPRVVGMTDDGEEIKANTGRFGPYIQIGKLYVSIKPLDPHDITLEEAKELLAAKLQKDAEKHIATFGKIQVLNGQYGPYVTDGTKNAKIPKSMDPKSLTEADCFELLANAPARKAGGRRSFSKKGKALLAGRGLTKKPLKRKPRKKK
jgi:DNA topoisomerase-1